MDETNRPPANWAFRSRDGVQSFWGRFPAECDFFNLLAEFSLLQEVPSGFEKALYSCHITDFNSLKSRLAPLETWAHCHAEVRDDQQWIAIWVALCLEGEAALRRFLQATGVSGLLPDTLAEAFFIYAWHLPVPDFQALLRDFRPKLLNLCRRAEKQSSGTVKDLVIGIARHPDHRLSLAHADITSAANAWRESGQLPRTLLEMALPDRLLGPSLPTYVVRYRLGEEVDWLWDQLRNGSSEAQFLAGMLLFDIGKTNALVKILALADAGLVPSAIPVRILACSAMAITYSCPPLHTRIPEDREAQVLALIIEVLSDPTWHLAALVLLMAVANPLPAVEAVTHMVDMRVQEPHLFDTPLEAIVAVLLGMYKHACHSNDSEWRQRLARQLVDWVTSGNRFKELLALRIVERGGLTLAARMASFCRNDLFYSPTSYWWDKDTYPSDSRSFRCVAWSQQTVAQQDATLSNALTQGEPQKLLDSRSTILPGIDELSFNALQADVVAQLALRSAAMEREDLMSWATVAFAQIADDELKAAHGKSLYFTIGKNNSSPIASKAFAYFSRIIGCFNIPASCSQRVDVLFRRLTSSTELRSKCEAIGHLYRTQAMDIEAAWCLTLAKLCNDSRAESVILDNCEEYFKRAFENELINMYHKERRSPLHTAGDDAMWADSTGPFLESSGDSRDPKVTLQLLFRANAAEATTNQVCAAVFLTLWEWTRARAAEVLGVTKSKAETAKEQMLRQLRKTARQEV